MRIPKSLLELLGFLPFIHISKAPMINLSKASSSLTKSSTSVLECSELPLDVLISIAERLLSPEDLVAFGAVCRSWRWAIAKENFVITSHQLQLQLQLVPWLMICEWEKDFDLNPKSSSNIRKFYSLSKQKIYKLPHPKEPKEAYSSLGWLLTSTVDKGISLFHPLSQTRIRLPDHRFYWLDKFALSARPSTSDYVVVVTHHSSRLQIGYLSFWRAGSPSWKTIKYGPFLHDIAYYKGQFYVLDCQGRVLLLNIDHHDHDHDHCNYHYLKPMNIVLKPTIDATSWPYDMDMLYLVESEGALLVVEAKQHFWSPRMRHVGKRTTSFRVYEVGFKDRTLAKVESLGDSALFLSHNSSSFSIRTSFDYNNIGLCKPNCIYFADNYRRLGSYEVRNTDIGIFHLKNGKMERFFNLENRRCYLPLWFQPTFF